MRGETVQVLTAATKTDRYGNTVEDWTSPASVDVTTLAPAEPRPSQEPVQDARNSVVSGWTLYLPAGTAVTAANRVRVRGKDYPVQGEPAVWGSRGIVVQAFVTEG